MASWTTLFSAGSKVRASTYSAHITEVRRLAAVKTADDSLTSSTYATDGELTVAIPQAGTFEVRAFLIYDGPTGGTNGRLKIRFNFPTGALSMGHFGGKNNTAVTDANMTDIDIGAVYNATTSPTADFNLPTVNVASYLTALFEGTLVATAAGTLSIDRAQIVTSGTTTLRKHSRLTAVFTGL